jgi:hypothetical protein
MDWIVYYSGEICTQPEVFAPPWESQAWHIRTTCDSNLVAIFDTFYFMGFNSGAAGALVKTDNYK